MAVCTDRSVFYHVPKTGGIWVKEAMRQAGLQYGQCKDKRVSHPFGLKREHATPDVVRDEEKAGRFSFCFVRHPVGWLQSFWAFRVKTQWLDAKFPPDWYWDDEFNTFVGNLVEAYPGGFVTELYQFYTGEDGRKVDFIGRQESLEDDLVRALTLAGETFNEEHLRATRWRNISSKGRRLSRLCVMNRQVEAQVLDAERWVLDTFYD